MILTDFALSFIHLLPQWTFVKKTALLEGEKIAKVQKQAISTRVKIKICLPIAAHYPTYGARATYARVADFSLFSYLYDSLGCCAF